MGVTAGARHQLRLLANHSRRELGLATLTGILVGVAVTAFDWMTSVQLLDRAREAPLAVQAFAPVLGLAVAAIALRWMASGATPSTSDEYIKAFHDPTRPLDPRPALGRIIAGIATLGSGGALGLEGPSLYLGASIGSSLQSRVSRTVSRRDAKVLMVAGAAAGVAAIFKAPATGAIFALEVPYQDDTAHDMLLPALIASAVSYLTFVALLGTAPLFNVRGSPPFDMRDLGGAIVLGLLCGVGARGFAILVQLSKRLAGMGSAPARVLIAGLTMAALFAISQAAFGRGLTGGSGYAVIAWLEEPGNGVGLVALLLVLRLVATAATLAGGGVGGLFVPLVVAGAIVGKITALVIGDPATDLFPLIGVAAFLGAGYRTPLAGVVFVAETTGRPGFVVPGLIASVVAQLVMGRSSVSPYQRQGRGGHLERRFALPVASAITAEVRTVPPDTTLDDFYHHHLLLIRQDVVPVVDGNRYVAMLTANDLHRIPRDEWSVRTVMDIAHTDWPTGAPDWTIRDAVRVMESADLDTIALVDGDSSYVGLVSTAEIVKLDEILEHGG